jgi:purine nucleoside phosphorylase
MKDKVPAIGVIGGSGLYQMEELRDASEHKIETPFGAPSDALVGGMIGERQVFRRWHRGACVVCRTDQRELA